MKASQLLRVLGFGLAAAFGLSCTDRLVEPTGSVSQRAIFGNSDFVEYPQIETTDQRRRANAVGVLLDDVTFGLPLPCDEFEGSCDLPIDVIGQSGASLCPDQPPLSEQPTLLIEGFQEPCSAFLVGSRTVAGAAHCFTSATDPTARLADAQAVCSNKLVVFGFALGRAEPSFVALRDVYRCSEVTAIGDGSLGEDWIVFDVERVVTGRTPLEVRRSGTVLSGERLETAGYPAGLPLKLAGGAEVKSVTPDEILTNLDELPGSSGSPVFNADTGLVEGVLVAGPVSFENVDPQGNVVPPGTLDSCFRLLAACSDTTGCDEPLPFTRILPIANLLAALGPAEPGGIAIGVPEGCGSNDGSVLNSRPYTGPRSLAVVPRPFRHDALPEAASQEALDQLLIADCPGAGATPLNQLVLLDPMASSSFDSVVATIQPRSGGHWRALAYRADRGDLIGVSHPPGAPSFQVLSIVTTNGGDSCQDTCSSAQNGVCEDGGPGSVSGSCGAGTDCSDCGELAQPETCLNTCGPNNDGSGSLAGNGVCDDGGPNAASSSCELGADCQDCGARVETSRKPPPGQTALLFEAPASDRIPVGLSWNAEAGVVSVLLDAQEPGGTPLLRRFDELGQPSTVPETPVNLDACAPTVDPPGAVVPLTPGQAAGLISAEGDDVVLCNGTHTEVGTSTTTTLFSRLVTTAPDGTPGAVLAADGVFAEPECDSETFAHRTVVWGMNREGTVVASVNAPRGLCMLGGATGASLLPLADAAGGFFANVTAGRAICPTLAADTDRDGIKDCWEVNGGYDLDLNGVNEYTFPADMAPSVGTKDIYVEIDFMGAQPGQPNSSHRPRQDVIDRVKDVFRNAPARPEAPNGWRLHVQVDDEIPHENEVFFDASISPGERLPPASIRRFTDLKTRFDCIPGQPTNRFGCFGTAAERAHAEATFVAVAKSIFFRYGISVHGQWNSDAVGIAIIGGGDLLLSHAGGSVSEPSKLLAGLPLDFDEEVGTLLHELGHTLNLEHGGRQQRNYKPNYFSVMNYFFDSALPDTNAPMEFSSAALPALDENNLDEVVGVTGPLYPPSSSQTGNRDTFWWTTQDPTRPPCLILGSVANGNCASFRGTADGSPLNWNFPVNQVATDRQAQSDINGDGFRGILAGHNDWAGMSVAFANRSGRTGQAAGRVPDEGAPDGFTIDGDGDGVIDRFDNCSEQENPDQRDSDGDNIGDVCDTAGELRLTARRDPSAPFFVDDELALAAPRSFVLPERLSMLSGSAQRTFVILSFSTAGGELVECRYNPGRPRRGFSVDFYELTRCSDGTEAGDTMSGDRFHLHVELQGQGEVAVVVEATLSE